MEERIIMVSQLEKEFESIVDKKDEPQNKKKPLLIIDDNPEVIEALSVVLNKDYKLLICYSYEEVLQKMNSEIKVVLLDIKMAYKDGIEIFSLLKNQYPNLKIIFHSAYAGNNEQAKLAESLPHSGYLTKGNYDIVELLQTIKQAF